MTDLLNGFVTLFTDPMALLFVLGAAIAGVLVGATPGLTSAAAIAMLVPVTLYMEPLHALAALVVIAKAGRFGGSIAAIMFNTPGTAAAAATTIDGNPMSRSGQSGKALRTAATASAIGDFIGDLLLIFGAVWIASLTEKFGPTEYFAIYLSAFLVISTVIGSSIIKGLIATGAGIVVAMIGPDAMEGTIRLNFGLFDLNAGLHLVPLLIGMFVIAEVLIQLENQVRSKGTAQVLGKPVPGGEHLTLPEVRRILPVIGRSSIIGSLIGILPGLGSSVAAFAAYGQEKARSKQPEAWGRGCIEGVAAPEAANNAVSGPSMIPLLALGIPGSTIAAIILGVFLIHGIQVGPGIFDNPESRQIVFGFFAAGLLGILIYFIIGFFGAGLIGRLIAKVPVNILFPWIFLTCFVSAYAARTNIFDVFVMCVAGLFGYLMRKGGYSTAAFLIAFVLAKEAEFRFRQSLVLSNDGILIYLQKPVALSFLAVALGVVVFQIRKNHVSKRANET
jgi:putative tricarboxylic transport membrane protein